MDARASKLHEAVEHYVTSSFMICYCSSQSYSKLQEAVEHYVTSSFMICYCSSQSYSKLQQAVEHYVTSSFMICYCSSQSKKDDIGGTRGTRGTEEKYLHTKFLSEHLSKRNHLRDIVVNGSIILKWAL
jgi:hypothetical protein